MTTIEIEVQVVCDSCGKELDATHNVRHGRLLVAPCEKCLDKAAEDARDDA